MITSSEMANLLTLIANLDNFHSTQSQEKFAQKVDAWHGVVQDQDYGACVRVVNTHYADPNSKSITAGVLRSKAQAFAPVAPPPTSGAPEDVARRERACPSPACRCTHLECFDGFLDKEETRERDGRKYPAVKRCSICKSALEARTGVAAR